MLARQHYKKWRVPLAAFFALTFVFGVAPVVGDEFQTSLITADVSPQLIQSNPALAKKTLLDATNEFVKDCERFKMQECAEHGHALLNDIANSGDKVGQTLPAVEKFQDQYDAEVALRACKYGLGEIATDLTATQKLLNTFAVRYGPSMQESEVETKAKALNAAVWALNAVVDSCISR